VNTCQTDAKSENRAERPFGLFCAALETD